MHTQSKALREKRGGIVSEMHAIITAAEAEDRELTAEETELHAKLDGEQEALKLRYERLERQFDLNAESRERIEQEHEEQTGSVEGADERQESADNYDVAFRNWAIHGMADLSAEHRTLMQQHYDTRAQSVGTDSAGGYTVPEGFQAELDQAMLAFGGMRAVARILPTASGNDIPWPTSNDTSNEGEIIAENAAHNAQDVTFGQAMLNAYMYSSKIVRVSEQLLQDSFLNLNTLLPQLLGERIARITNRHFTVGTGTAQPNGAVTASTVGPTAAAAAALAYGDLVNLEHSVDPAYRPNGRFMFHDDSLKLCKKLQDDNKNPIWLTGVATREPDTILGYQYTVNQHMAKPTTGQKAMLFGDFQKYIIRDVAGARVLRLVERYAEYLQVGFLGFSRHDGELIDAGTNPIKHLKMA